MATIFATRLRAADRAAGKSLSAARLIVGQMAARTIAALRDARNRERFCILGTKKTPAMLQNRDSTHDPDSSFARNEACAIELRY